MVGDISTFSHWQARFVSTNVIKVSKIVKMIMIALKVIVIMYS